MTREEALEALKVIQAGLARNEWLYKDIPQSHIRYAKNKNRDSADAEERGENESAEN